VPKNNINVAFDNMGATRTGAGDELAHRLASPGVRLGLSPFESHVVGIAALPQQVEWKLDNFGVFSQLA